MSFVTAKAYAVRAKSSKDTNEKISLVADAIHELVRALEDMERRIKRIEASTNKLR